MIGGYIQYLIVSDILGADLWFVGIPIAVGSVFLVGLVFQHLVLRELYVEGKVLSYREVTEYATIVTIGAMVLYRSVAIVLSGPYIYAPPTPFGLGQLGTLSVSGSKVVAFWGAIIILMAFYLFIKKTWWGRALQAAAQSREGALVAGVNLRTVDALAFGGGAALAAAAGALLAPVFYVFPDSGAITTMKGFEIIVLGGMGSIPGSIIGGLLLGIIENLGSVFISASFRDVYGFTLLLLVLVIRPTGLFGERERADVV